MSSSDSHDHEDRGIGGSTLPIGDLVAQLIDGGNPSDLQVEDLLKQLGIQAETLASDSLADLAYAEWTARLERGETLSQDDFLARFPSVADQLQRQWVLDAGLAAISNDPRWSETLCSADSPSAEVNPQSIASPKDKPLPVRLGKYKIVSRLGVGGQAEIFRGWHPDLQRDVVIKQLRLPGSPVFAKSPVHAKDIASVFAEGRILAQLSHPNIAQVYDLNQDSESSLPFLVMEYISGTSLDQFYLMSPLSIGQAVQLVVKIAHAVEAAHQKGIVHRDIKPQNIVVMADGVPKLIDFGLGYAADVWHAESPEPGVRGTLGYMSPEQARSDANSIGKTTDVFGLGGVLYFLLTGRAPCEFSKGANGATLIKALDRVRNCQWDRAPLNDERVPQALAQICTKAMSANPADRYQSAAELAVELESVMNHPAGKKSGPLALVAIAATVIGVAIVGFGLPGTWGGKPVQNYSDSPAARTHLAEYSPGLRLHVYRDEKRLEIVDAVPIIDGSLLSITSHIPAGFTAMLFTINGDGRIQLVAKEKADKLSRDWRFPADGSATVPLVGPAGTECIVYVGASADSAIPEKVMAVWTGRANWPAIPHDSVLRLNHETVSIEQAGRDLGQPAFGTVSASEQVREKLEAFGRALARQGFVVEAIAFRHQPK